MEITIVLNEVEFIVSSVIPPVIGALYFGYKYYLGIKK